MGGVDINELKATLAKEKQRRYIDVVQLRAVSRSRRARTRDSSSDSRSASQNDLRELLRREMPNAPDYFSSVEKALDRGIGDRARAFDLLSNSRRPVVPKLTRLDKPFLIWGLRNGSEATDLLIDYNIEAGNSWAKIYSHYSSDGAFIVSDELNFYFFWQNSSATDAVLNVESLVTLNGDLYAMAHPGWLWGPIWGEGTIGRVSVGVGAQLTVLEWWNQPPTTPSSQPGQSESVGSVEVSGGFSLWSSGHYRHAPVSGSYHIYYDTLWVPKDGVVVFEVGLAMGYDAFGNGGSCYSDFDFSTFQVKCPYLAIEVVA